MDVCHLRGDFRTCTRPEPLGAEVVQSAHHGSSNDPVQRQGKWWKLSDVNWVLMLDVAVPECGRFCGALLWRQSPVPRVGVPLAGIGWQERVVVCPSHAAMGLP